MNISGSFREFKSNFMLENISSNQLREFSLGRFFISQNECSFMSKVLWSPTLFITAFSIKSPNFPQCELRVRGRSQKFSDEMMSIGYWGILRFRLDNRRNNWLALALAMSFFANTNNSLSINACQLFVNWIYEFASTTIIKSLTPATSIIKSSNISENKPQKRGERSKQEIIN